MTFDMTEIIKAVITLVTLLITGLLIPYIRSKVDADKFSRLSEMVSIFVGAAEQLYNSNQGQEKKQYVLAKLAEAGYKVDGAEIDAMIESTVLALHNALKGGAA